MRTFLRLVLVVAVLGGGIAYVIQRGSGGTLVLTGIVTTHDTIVSAQIPGQLRDLLVKEGDRVTAGQVVAVIAPDELQADRAYFTQAAAGAREQIEEGEAALRFQQQQTDAQVRQAESQLAAAEAAERSAAADLENARLTFARNQRLVNGGVVSAEQFDQSRTTRDALEAHVASLAKQTEWARGAVALARTNAEQITVRRSQLSASRHGSAAADAQRDKATVRLAYTDVRAPIAGLVDVRAARPGEVVAAGQPILTLVNPDDFWVRADVEESYIDRVKVGDTLTVRLPSGVELPGTVFFRGVDAGFATQRDVSRTKRDIKTFEVRLRVDNKARTLAIGMTAYVLFPTGR